MLRNDKAFYSLSKIQLKHSNKDSLTYFINSYPISKYIVALLLGCISSFALPPYSFILVLPLCFWGLLELLWKMSGIKRRFLLGYSFGYGHFFFSLSWIGNALMVEADKFAWMKPLALFGIPAFTAVFIGLVTLLSGWVRNSRLAMWWLFSINWVAIEFARSYLIIPFPWNLMGYCLAPFISISQVASLVGIYGLSLLVVLMSTVLFTKSIRMMMMMAVIFVISTLFGVWQLQMDVGQKTNSYLRLVQPNPKEHHLGDPSKREDQIYKLLQLSKQLHPEQPLVVIWPEAVLPLLPGSRILMDIAAILPPNSWLVSGADRVVSGGQGEEYYNSIVSSDSKGNLVSTYDKHILVPFGEYIPLRRFIPGGLDKIAYGIGDFNTGEEYSLIKMADSYAVPLVCYEALFSLFVNNFPVEKADFLLNVTNDNWFGDSLGPYQHFTMAKFRAIEYGLPLVRVANTGISGVVDEYGREVMSIPLNKSGVLDVQLRRSIGKVTFYCAHNFMIMSCLVACLVISYILILRRQKRK